MKNFSKRIAALSPAQLKLFKLRLKQEGIDLDTEIKTVESNIFPPIEPCEEKEYYPLSSVQKRLYTLSQLEGTGDVFSVSTMRVIRENLDKDRVESVFKALIQRHKSFRTSFAFIKGEPVQRIHDQVEFELEYYDLTKNVKVETEDERGLFGQVSDVSGEENEPATGNMEQAAALISSFIRPFEISRPPLLRVGLIKLAEKKYVLMVDMHHIMSDALSKRIIWNDFNCLYKGLPLKELKIQYSDFSWWQLSKAVKSAVNRQETYWLKEFQGKIPVINFPTDYERPVNKSSEGGYRFFKIEKEITTALKAMALKENTTMFIMMLAVYYVFLSKICRQRDIVVGVPTAGRRHSGLDDIIGMFVNTLALRNYPEDEITFSDFLRHTRERTLEAFANQDYQFEDLVNQLITQRDPGRNPIFDAFFSFRAPGVSQELPINLSDEEDSSFAPGEENSHQGTTLSMFDLYFLGAEITGELFLVLTYSAKLFKKETIERFTGYIKDIISAVVENNSIKLERIEISHNLGFAQSAILHDEEDDFGF